MGVVMRLFGLLPALGGTPLGCSATLRNRRSKSGLGVSAPTSRAMSMKRFDCSGSSGSVLGLRGMNGVRS